VPSPLTSAAARVAALLLALLAAAGIARAQAPAVDLYLFWRAGCPHCEREIAFLDRLAAREPALRVHQFEIYRDRANATLMMRVADRLGVEGGSVPFTVIGNRAWSGYLDDSTTGRELEAKVAECLAGGCPDAVAPILRGEAGGGTTTRGPAALPAAVNLPLFGPVSTAALSLPALTVLLAAVDGFNPCAMWVLVFLLGLLAGMRDRTRMWLLGGAFVAASGLVYLLILGAWLNVLLFAGAIIWVRLAVGAVALAGGAHYVRSFFRGGPAVCEVTAPARRQQVLARLKDLAGRGDFLAALAGIVALALAVNVVEFLCSAGIPAVYTQVLALAALPPWQYAAYLLLYVAVFMLDDIIVLAVALKSLEVTGMTGTYSRWSGLVGGVVLIAIGAALIAKPEWLSFG
jgi:hypothetical protein